MHAAHLFAKFAVTPRSIGRGLLALSLFLASALTASAAQPQTLYVATGTFSVRGILYTIDPTTGAVLTTVGPLNDAAGNNYGMAGMRYDPFNGVLYGAVGGESPFDPSFLITIDPATALVTPIGPFGDVLTDIAIDPTTGIMYGVSGFDQKFFTVDLATGHATQIGSTGLGFQMGGGLGVNAAGTLFGVDYFSFYSYNKTTGAPTLIGLTLLPDLVRAADFNSSGVFYGLEGGGGSDNTHLRFLVTIDLTSGLGLLVAPILINDLDGLAFVPAPGQVQMVGIVSRMVQGGSGTFDIDLTSGAAVECRNGAGGNYTLVLTFSNNLRSVDGASVGCGTVSSSAIGPNPNQYSVNLTGQGACNAQYNTVTLSNVTDSAGNHSATVVSPRWGLLIGDTTGDGTVNAGDIGQTKSQSGQTVSGSNFRQDVTGDGSINAGDIGLVKSKSGTGLP